MFGQTTCASQFSIIAFTLFWSMICGSRRWTPTIDLGCYIVLQAVSMSLWVGCLFLASFEKRNDIGSDIHIIICFPKNFGGLRYCCRFKIVLLLLVWFIYLDLRGLWLTSCFDLFHFCWQHACRSFCWQLPRWFDQEPICCVCNANLLVAVFAFAARRSLNNNIQHQKTSENTWTSSTVSLIKNWIIHRTMILWHTLTQSLRFLFRTDTQHWCIYFQKICWRSELDAWIVASQCLRSLFWHCSLGSSVAAAAGGKNLPPICRESCVPPIALIFVDCQTMQKKKFTVLLPGSFSPNDPGKIMEFWNIIKGEIGWPLQLSHLDQTFLVWVTMVTASIRLCSQSVSLGGYDSASRPFVFVCRLFSCWL